MTCSRCVTAILSLCLALVTGLAIAQTTPKKPVKKGETESTGKPADFRSQHFYIHTDLPAADAKELLARLETELKLISNYWGRPPVGIIEAYVAKDISKWPADAMDPDGRRQIEAGAGVTLSQVLSNSKGFVAKAVVYACADRGTPQHEAVHAYCAQAFGTTGPLWYSEGMAEMGHYWRDREKAVTCDPYVVEFLHKSPVKSIDKIVNAKEITGDSWQNYAWRWALCELLASNPNYQSKFLPLGLSFLNKQKDASFEQTYGAMAEQIQFEYKFFLEHVDLGYRVDLCAIDWNRKFHALIGSASSTAHVLADHGWQPSSLQLAADTEYEYTATGSWQTSKDSGELTADGDDKGQGRLVGVVLKNYEFSEPFDLGVSGTFKAPSDGKLYLRCKDAWNELADNKGTVTVKFKLKSKDTSSPSKAVGSEASAAK